MKAKRKPAVILLGHGSRIKGAGTDMERVAARLRECHGFSTVVCCFMSRHGPHFPETLEKVVSSGEDEILVVPYFLHSGLHILLDIPYMMQLEAAKYPGIQLFLGANLGYDDILVDLVMKRIMEAENAIDIREVRLPSRSDFPIPPGQDEFVPMKPEEAKRYREESGRHEH